MSGADPKAPVTAEPPAVRFRAVEKVYAGPTPVRALDGVSLDIPRGQLAAIVGPSGSGKSTLLHLAAGIDSPTAGAIEVAGRPLAALDDDELTRHRRGAVGMVYQFFHLLPTLSARENVALPAMLAGGRERDVLARADELLAAVGLAERRHARPHTLSGGEMQRVSLARALLPGPALLLADEPTGNLDSKSGAQVLGLIRDLARRHRAAVLLVTHSAEAAAIAERVIELRDGRVVGDRSTAA
jgi:putative ABC transport system ATP-binding protein